MQAPDRDFIGGLLTAAFGLAAAAYAWAHYELGSLERMGPGLFPVVVGCALALLGVTIAVPALFHHREIRFRELRPFAAVTVGLVSFALAIGTLGLVPAIVALMIAATVADRQLSAIEAALLTAGLIIAVLLIFQVGLELPVHAFRWAF